MDEKKYLYEIDSYCSHPELRAVVKRIAEEDIDLSHGIYEGPDD